MLNLSAGATRAAVVPAMGAGMAGLWLGSRPILRPWLGQVDEGPFALAMNVLAPFSNRVAGGFRHDGVDHALTPNLPGETFAIHGDAFQRPWAVTEQSDSAVALRLAEGRFEPFRYEADLHYGLQETALRVSLTLTNRAQRALPFGAGFHPWFPRSAQTRLQFSATGYWPETAQHLPATNAAVALPPTLDFATFGSLPEGLINAGFADWSGQAVIHQGPDAVSLRVSAEGLSTAILYSPSAAADFFCFEPVSHPVNAHNLPNQPGLVVLPPGDSLTVTMTLDWQ